MSPDSDVDCPPRRGKASNLIPLWPAQGLGGGVESPPRAIAPHPTPRKIWHFGVWLELGAVSHYLDGDHGGVQETLLELGLAQEVPDVRAQTRRPTAALLHPHQLQHPAQALQGRCLEGDRLILRSFMFHSLGSVECGFHSLIT